MALFFYDMIYTSFKPHLFLSHSSTDWYTLYSNLIFFIFFFTIWSTLPSSPIFLKSFFLHNLIYFLFKFLSNREVILHESQPIHPMYIYVICICTSSLAHYWHYWFKSIFFLFVSQFDLHLVQTPFFSSFSSTIRFTHCWIPIFMVFCNVFSSNIFIIYIICFSLNFSHSYNFNFFFFYLVNK